MNVSVLMAVYNRENTIESAVESIISQLSFGDELIISNDGSFDETSKICDNLQKKYPEIIKVYNHENFGIEKNMFFLFEKASKDIIIINDSDDISLANRVLKISEVFNENKNINVIYHNAYIMNEMSNVDLNSNFFKTFHQKNKKNFCLTRTTFYGAMMCFRTKFIKDNLNYLNNKFVHAWDRTLGFVGLKKKSLLFLDDKLLNYRRWNGNISIKKRKSLLSRLNVRFKWLRLYLSIKK